MSRNIMSVFNQRTRENDPFESLPLPVKAVESPQPQQSQEAFARPCIKLGKTLVFKGELSVGEDVLLLGRVEGSMTHSESLTVGIGGIIVGDVSGRSITVKGTVEGDIEATESVVIVPGAVVNGDIVSPRVNIIEGAHFNGSVKMVASQAAAKNSSNLMADGTLTEEAVDQLLHLLSERKKA